MARGLERFLTSCTPRKERRKAWPGNRQRPPALPPGARRDVDRSRRHLAAPAYPPSAQRPFPSSSRRCPEAPAAVIATENQQAAGAVAVGCDVLIAGAGRRAARAQLGPAVGLKAGAGHIRARTLSFFSFFLELSLSLSLHFSSSSLKAACSRRMAHSGSAY